MVLPDYQRPFEQADFRGYFTWTAALSERLNRPLYHACHGDELEEILDANQLDLRSSWGLMHPAFGEHTCPGVWCGLNYFNQGNKYGPCLIEFPLDVLNGRSFIAFRRIGDRHRHFFVQYETRIPLFAYEDDTWRKVKAAEYFQVGTQDSLWLKNGAIYDVILTAPLRLKDAVVKGVNHPSCIPGKCDGSTTEESTEVVGEAAHDAFLRVLERNPGYRKFAKMFPDMIGESFALELPTPAAAEDD